MRTKKNKNNGNRNEKRKEEEAGVKQGGETGIEETIRVEGREGGDRKRR